VKISSKSVNFRSGLLILKFASALKIALTVTLACYIRNQRARELGRAYFKEFGQRRFWSKGTLLEFKRALLPLKRALFVFFLEKKTYLPTPAMHPKLSGA